MKNILQILASLILFAAIATWLATGMNRGWTKTEVQVKTLDPVTEIEGISYQKKFQPGVDFLGAAFGSSVLLGGASFFFRKSNKQQQPNK